MRAEGRSNVDIASDLGRTPAAIRSAHRIANRRGPTARPQRVQKPWTDEEIKQAESLRAQGSTFRSIAASLQRSLSSVEHKFRYEVRGEEFRTRLRAHPTETVNSRQPWSQEELKRLTDMRESGSKIAEIARSMGRSEGGVKVRLRLALQGHTDSFRSYTPQEDEKLAQLKAAGLSWNAIHANMPHRCIGSLKYRLRSTQAQCSNTKRGQGWTEEEVDQVHKLRADGVKILDIARALSRGYTGVCHVLRDRKQDLAEKESPTS